MATAFSINQYRDPGHVDMSATFKAQTYKQQLYDTNVAQTQQLINQYAGVDLMRDVDQKYLGERLNTLVNYVNQSGAQDWSRRSIANEVSNYIGQALDENVMAGISSTQIYRRQQAEIEQKKKEGKYGVENAWLATRDFERYMRSNKIGDKYNAGQYVDYVDVKKKILENAKLIKDMGGEVYFKEGDSNPYFRTINKGEKLTPEKVRQWSQIVLGNEGIRQLGITGLYEYKGKNPIEIKNDFKEYINSQIERNNKISADIKLTSTNKKGKELEQLKALSQQYDQNTEILKGRLNMDENPDHMVSEMYINRQLDLFAKTLSYDNIVDYKIDDTPLKVKNYNLEVLKENNANTYRNAQLAIERDKLAVENLKAEAQLRSSGQKYNKKTGELEWDMSNPNNPYTGVNKVTNVDEKTPEKVEPVSNTYNTADAAYNSVLGLVSTKLKAELDKPENSALKNEFGINKDNIAYIAGQLINTPSKYGKLDKLIGTIEGLKGKIDYARQMIYTAKSYDEKLTPAMVEIEDRAKKIFDQPRGNNFTPGDVNLGGNAKANYELYTNGYTVDWKGNLVKGDAKVQNDANGRIVREIGVINNMLANSDLDDSQILYLKRARDLKFNSLNIDKKNKDNIKSKLYLADNASFLENVTDVIKKSLPAKASLAAIGADWFINNVVNRDDSSAAKSDISAWLKPSGKRSYTDRLGNHWDDLWTTNRDNNDIGDSDLGKGKSKESLFDNNIKSMLNLGIKDMQSNVMLPQSQSLILDNSDKNIAPLLPILKSLIPENAELVKDGVTKMTVNENGGYNLTVPVKIGKEIQNITVQASQEDLPSGLTNLINTNSNSIYNANSKFPQSTAVETELPDTVEDYHENDVKYAPASERTRLLNYEPPTKQDLYDYINTAYDSKIVDKFKTKIDDIVNESLKISTVAENGQWTIVGSNKKSDVYRKETREGEYSPESLYDSKYNTIYNIKKEQLDKLLNGRK